MKRQKTNAKLKSIITKVNKKQIAEKKTKIVIKQDNKHSNTKQKDIKILRSNSRAQKVSNSKITKADKNADPKIFSLTDKQVENYKIYEDEFYNKSTGQLKAILKENNQVISGLKDDLVQRCALGKLLGAFTKMSYLFYWKTEI